MRALALATGLVLGVVAFATPVPARAAEVPGAFKDITITAASGKGPIYPWEQVRVSANWSVPDGTPAGSTFSMSWPTEKLKGNTGSLALKNDKGDVVANCAMTAGGVSCTLTDFVSSHPYEIGGKVWFAVNQVNAGEKTDIDIPFTIGSKTVTVRYRTDGSVPFGGIDFWKDGGVYPGGADWYLYFPGETKGQQIDYRNVVVDDNLGAGQSIVPGSFVLQHATQLNPQGTWPVWNDAPSSLYTVTLDRAHKSFQFKAPLLAKGGWWRLTYKVTVNSGYAGDLTNTMKAKWDGSDSKSTTRTESYFNNGGTGSGVMKSVSVGDTVWFDENRNGLQDEGAGSGIPGAVLELTGPNGEKVKDVFGKEVAPITTGQAGTYLFENLPPLSAGQHYTVTVAKAPDGYTPTIANVGNDREKDSSTGSATSGELTTDGAKDLSLDFGFVKKSSVMVGDYVWFDQNRNGVQDEGPGSGLAGVELKLTGPNGQPVNDIFGKPVAPTTTDQNGNYRFENLPLLPAGQHYTVTVTKAPDGYNPTIANAGNDPEKDSSTGSATSHELDKDGARDLGLDFGFVKQLVSLGDYVWWDANRDGVQQKDEKPVTGMTVTLEDANGKTVKTTKTDAKGYFAFTDLTPGAQYTVVFHKPANSAFTNDNAGGDDATDSDAPANGRVPVTAPTKGNNQSDPGKADLPTIDAGLVQINLTLSKKLITNAPYTTATQVSYLLVPHNDGPSAAMAGWSVTDVPQPELKLLSISGEGYSCKGLTCTSSERLAPGANGKPIVVTFQLPAAANTPVTYRNVAYVSPVGGDAPETNPLVIPTIHTNTTTSTTDNDAQASLTLTNHGEVIPLPTPPAPKPNDPGRRPAPLPNTGADLPLGALVGAFMALVGGTLLVVQGARRRARQRG